MTQPKVVFRPVLRSPKPQSDRLLGGETKAVPVTVQGSGLSDRLLNGTRTFASGLLETVLVLFFLLVSGDTFLRRLVEILPRFKDKRQAVDISQQIESDVSAYLFTITLMNLAVGNRHGHGVLRGGRPFVVGNRSFPA